MKKHGYIGLISILIIDAIALLVGVGVLIRAVGETKIVVAEDYRQRAHAAATACAEHALIELKDTTLYAGDELLHVNEDTCYIMLIAGYGESSRVIQTTSTVATYTRKIKITIDDINPILKISSWEDVVDF
jgi:hypothetical protein